MTTPQSFVVGARLGDGTTARWHVPAADAQEARVIVENDAATLKPSPILACIPGGKA